MSEGATTWQGTPGCSSRFGDAEAAGTGFVAGFELRAGVGLADAPQKFLERMEIIADGAVDADLAVAPAFGERDGDGIVDSLAPARLALRGRRCDSSSAVPTAQ